MSDNLLFTPGALTAHARAMFLSADVNEVDADVIADDLRMVNLRGVDSHDVSRIPMYLERRRRGLVNPGPQVAVTKAADAVAHVDGGNGMGFVPSHAAMTTACDLASDAAPLEAPMHVGHPGAIGSEYMPSRATAGTSRFLPDWQGRLTARTSSGIPQ